MNRHYLLALPAFVLVVVLAAVRVVAHTESGPLHAPEAGFEVHHLPYGGGVDHEFVNVAWADLEPAQGSFTGPGWTTITNALTNTTSGLKIRLTAGANSPAWVKTSDGPCVTVTVSGAAGALSGCTPRFWDTSNQFWPQYRALLDEMNRRYGANPKLLTVTACGAQTSLNCEPFITGNKTSDAALFKAGLTEATDRAALLTSVQEVARAFPAQRVSIATHTAWNIPVSGGYSLSWPKERDLLQQLRTTYGNDRLVIQNNGIGGNTSTWNGSPGSAPDLWSYIRNDPGRDGFQGGYKGVAGDTVLSHAVNDMHAEFFENIQGLTTAQVQSYDAMMKSNAAAPRATVALADAAGSTPTAASLSPAHMSGSSPPP